MPDSVPARRVEPGVVLLIDGHAFAYRAFFAIRHLKSPGGQPTNAIYGFIQMLRRLQERLQPLRTIVVWDGGLAPQRMALLPSYKSQRPEMPADLAGQFDPINEYLDASGIPWLRQDDVEADDLVATLARKLADNGQPVIIASSDKDFMQMVNDTIRLANPGDKTGQLWGAAEVRGKTGVEPHQIVDWLSLVGDAVDNIPGVPQVGPKTAARLLVEFGSIDELYRRVAEVGNDRLRQNLTENHDAVIRNQTMVRLREDLPGDFPELKSESSADSERLGGLFRRWGFKTWLAEVTGTTGEIAQQATLFAEK